LHRLFVGKLIKDDKTLLDFQRLLIENFYNIGLELG